MYQLCGTYSDAVAVLTRAGVQIRRQLMIIKTFIVCIVLVGITLILTELHRYQVYKEDIEQEDK